MKNLISDDLKQVLQENNVKGSQISEIKGYLEALKLYESLIESGLAKKRGNNLLSKDKVYLARTSFNS